MASNHAKEKKSGGKPKKGLILRLEKYILFRIALPFVFKLFSILPFKTKRVIFADYRFTDMPDNMVPVYEALKEMGYDIKTFFKPANVKAVTNPKMIMMFFRFIRQFAVSKYIIVTDYFPPLYLCRPRKGQKLIQLWHGAGAFKKWGYSAAENEWGNSRDEMEKYPIHWNYTHVIVSSPEVISHYADAFNINPDRIFAYGFPRSDVFFNAEFSKESRAKLEKIIPQCAGKKIMLYAPTFRGNTLHEAYNENILDISMLKEVFSDEYFLVTKYHPLSNSNPIPDEDMDFAQDISKSMDINEALCSADIIITDYSSLIFEYSLLLRPMVFYAYDLESYIDQRNFYYKYEDFVPGPIAKDNISLVEAIKSQVVSFDKEKTATFRDKFMCACDGFSTKRIIKELFTEQD